MEKTIKIQKKELTKLIFWAMAGYGDSNGGSYERGLPKLISRLAKECGMTERNFPPFGFKSSAELTGETKDKLVKALKVNYPRYKHFV